MDDDALLRLTHLTSEDFLLEDFLFGDLLLFGDSWGGMHDLAIGDNSRVALVSFISVTSTSPVFSSSLGSLGSVPIQTPGLSSSM